MLGILIGYFTAGMITNRLPSREIYPIYSWFLFSEVHYKKKEYMVVINNGPFFQQAGSRVTNPHSPVAYELIQRYGRALDKKDHHAAAQARSVFEKNFLPPKYKISGLANLF